MDTTHWIILSLLHTRTSGEAETQGQTHYNTTSLNQIIHSHELHDWSEVESKYIRSLPEDISHYNLNIPRSNSLHAREAPIPFGRLKRTHQPQPWFGCCQLIVTPGNDLRHNCQVNHQKVPVLWKERERAGTEPSKQVSRLISEVLLILGREQNFCGKSRKIMNSHPTFSCSFSLEQESSWIWKI